MFKIKEIENKKDKNTRRGNKYISNNNNNNNK